MFITTFEILKDSIVDDIHSFYSNGFDEHGPVVSPQYESRVLLKNKSPLYAYLQWLRESDAIDDEDLLTFEKLKNTRNLLAHRLFAIVTGQVEWRTKPNSMSLSHCCVRSVFWWVINVEFPTNLHYAGEEVDEKGIVPGSVLSLQMLIQVASGNTELFEHWRKGRVNA